MQEKIYIITTDTTKGLSNNTGAYSYSIGGRLTSHTIIYVTKPHVVPLGYFTSFEDAETYFAEHFANESGLGIDYCIVEIDKYHNTDLKN